MLKLLGSKSESSDVENSLAKLEELNNSLKGFTIVYNEIL